MVSSPPSPPSLCPTHQKRPFSKKKKKITESRLCFLVCVEIGLKSLHSCQQNCYTARRKEEEVVIMSVLAKGGGGTKYNAWSYSCSLISLVRFLYDQLHAEAKS
jgi:hypothetical protein